jgi:hypothetical protein
VEPEFFFILLGSLSLIAATLKVETEKETRERKTGRSRRASAVGYWFSGSIISIVGIVQKPPVGDGWNSSQLSHANSFLRSLTTFTKSCIDFGTDHSQRSVTNSAADWLRWPQKNFAQFFAQASVQRGCLQSARMDDKKLSRRSIVVSGDTGNKDKDKKKEKEKSKDKDKKDKDKSKDKDKKDKDKSKDKRSSSTESSSLSPKESSRSLTPTRKSSSSDLTSSGEKDKDGSRERMKRDKRKTSLKLSKKKSTRMELMPSPEDLADMFSKLMVCASFLSSCACIPKYLAPKYGSPARDSDTRDLLLVVLCRMSYNFQRSRERKWPKWETRPSGLSCLPTRVSLTHWSVFAFWLKGRACLGICPYKPPWRAFASDLARPVHQRWCINNVVPGHHVSHPYPFLLCPPTERQKWREQGFPGLLCQRSQNGGNCRGIEISSFGSLHTARYVVQAVQRARWCEWRC